MEKIRRQIPVRSFFVLFLVVVLGICFVILSNYGEKNYTAEGTIVSIEGENECHIKIISVDKNPYGICKGDIIRIHYERINDMNISHIGFSVISEGDKVQVLINSAISTGYYEAERIAV